MKLILLVSIALILHSCGSSEEERADELSIELCNCMKSAKAITEDHVIELNDTTSRMEKSKACLKSYAPKLKAALSEADNKQEFIKRTLKSLLKTECSLDLFKLVPYDNLKAELNE